MMNAKKLNNKNLSKSISWLDLLEIINTVISVCDGICVAPTKRMCSHVSEFSSAPGDDIILPQGSKFEQRLFIANQDERKLVKKLANADISVENFLNENITSQNGQLVIS